MFLEIASKLLRLGGMALTLIVLTVAACEEDIEPFAPGAELHYSMWGFLDASADTQWIRVTPVRQSILTDPGEVDGVVTLEHLESGETFMLNDSVFRFEPFGVVEEAEDALVHNFWTDAPIEFEETYRLTVTGPEGLTTSACRLSDLDILVVASGVEWIPDGRAFSVGAPTVRGYPSSVEDGLGHLAGIVSKVLPWDSCWTENNPGGNRGPCPMLAYFDGESAWLQGTVTVCGDSVFGLQVRLREIPDDPTQPAAVRQTWTNQDSFFRMGALASETTYELLFASGSPLALEDTTRFLAEDTLRFERAEEATMSYALERQGCPA